MVRPETGSLVVFLSQGKLWCKDVFLKISLLDKALEILTEGLALGSLVSPTVMEGAVVFRSEKSKIVWLRFRTLHL